MDQNGHSKPSTSKLANGTHSKVGAGLLNGKAASSAKSASDEKKPKSIQNDPNASSAYKSLFNTCEKAKNQQQPHWITHNPLFYWKTDLCPWARCLSALLVFYTKVPLCSIPFVPIWWFFLFLFLFFSLNSVFRICHSHFGEPTAGCMMCSHLHSRLSPCSVAHWDRLLFSLVELYMMMWMCLSEAAGILMQS